MIDIFNASVCNVKQKEQLKINCHAMINKLRVMHFIQVMISLLLGKLMTTFSNSVSSPLQEQQVTLMRQYPKMIPDRGGEISASSVYSLNKKCINTEHQQYQCNEVAKSTATAVVEKEKDGVEISQNHEEKSDKTSSFPFFCEDCHEPFMTPFMKICHENNHVGQKNLHQNNDTETEYQYDVNQRMNSIPSPLHHSIVEPDVAVTVPVPIQTERRPCFGYPCALFGCGKWFNEKQNLHQHMKFEHGDLYERRKWERHLYGEKRPYFGFVCAFEGCGKSFNERSSLKHHMTVMRHGNGRIERNTYQQYMMVPIAKRKIKQPRPYSCTVDGCGKKYIKELSLKRHMMMRHENERPKIERKGTFVVCFFPGCDKVFSSRFHYNDHIIYEHGNGTRRFLFQCPRCNCRFNNMRLLYHHYHVTCLHMKRNCPIIKIGKKTFYKCASPSCDDIFSAKNSRSRHLRAVHNITSKVPCPRCHEQFKDMSTLCLHTRMFCKMYWDDGDLSKIISRSHIILNVDNDEKNVTKAKDFDVLHST